MHHSEPVSHGRFSFFLWIFTGTWHYFSGNRKELFDTKAAAVRFCFLSFLHVSRLAGSFMPAVARFSVRHLSSGEPRGKHVTHERPTMIPVRLGIHSLYLHEGGRRLKQWSHLSRRNQKRYLSIDGCNHTSRVPSARVIVSSIIKEKASLSDDTSPDHCAVTTVKCLVTVQQRVSLQQLVHVVETPTIS